MTHEDIFVAILHEVTGVTEDLFRAVMRDVKARFPNNNWEVEVPAEEAKMMLERLRQEKAGILNWVLDGCRLALEGQLTQSSNMASDQGKANKPAG